MSPDPHRCSYTGCTTTTVKETHTFLMATTSEPAWRGRYGDATTTADTGDIDTSASSGGRKRVQGEEEEEEEVGEQAAGAGCDVVLAMAAVADRLAAALRATSFDALHTVKAVRGATGTLLVRGIAKRWVA